MIFLKCNFNFMTIYMKNDKKMRHFINSEIFCHRVCTVELKFSSIMQKKHNNFYFSLLDSLTDKDNDKEKTKLNDDLLTEKQKKDCINFTVYQWFSHFNFSSKLECLTLMSTSKDLIKEIKRWATKWNNDEVTFLFNKIKCDQIVLSS